MAFELNWHGKKKQQRRVAKKKTLQAWMKRKRQQKGLTLEELCQRAGLPRVSTPCEMEGRGAHFASYLIVADTLDELNKPDTGKKKP